MAYAWSSFHPVGRQFIHHRELSLQSAILIAGIGRKSGSIAVSAALWGMYTTNAGHP